MENDNREAVEVSDHKTLLLFSDDLDKVLAAFVIANGAAAMDSNVTIFFAFWGINVVRKNGNFTVVKKDMLSKMFGWMMPKGSGSLTLSKMHLLGAGTAMMKYVMRKKHVKMVPELIAEARDAGVRFVACTMSMDIMGIERDELLENVELGGVASFLDAAEKANVNLFI
ncbi:MAG: DsrE/DsrF/DrsH-like family protein [Syntrophobacteraceae bacterium]